MTKLQHYITAPLLSFLVWVYIIACVAYLVPGLATVGNGFAPTWVRLLVVGGLLTVIGKLTFYDIFDYIYHDSASKNLPGRWLRVTQWVLLLALSLVVGWQQVQFNFSDLIGNFTNTWPLLSRIFHPNWSQAGPVAAAMIQTLFLALMATVIAIPPAFVLSFLAARNLMPRNFWGNSVYYLVRTGATFIRSIEALVWAIIFTVWVGIGPFAGMLALSVHSLAALIKLYSEQIENIDPGPVEAIKATGATSVMVWIWAVVPQVLAPYLAFTIYRWDINVRMATIVGFVGGGGIGLLLKQQQDLMRWRDVGLIMLFIAAIVWIMDILSARLRQRLIK